MSSQAASISAWNTFLLCPSMVAAFSVSRYGPANRSAAFRKIAARASQGISLQAEFFARHPQVARVFLREIADFDPERPSPFGELIGSLLREVTHFLGARLDAESGRAVDPEHVITAIAGASLLHVVGSPLLNPGRSTAPLRGAEFDRHKRELARLVARLLDVDGPPCPLPAGADE